MQISRTSPLSLLQSEGIIKNNNKPPAAVGGNIYGCCLQTDSSVPRCFINDGFIALLCSAQAFQELPLFLFWQVEVKLYWSIVDSTLWLHAGSTQKLDCNTVGKLEFEFQELNNQLSFIFFPPSWCCHLFLLTKKKKKKDNIYFPSFSSDAFLTGVNVQ